MFFLIFRNSLTEKLLGKCANLSILKNFLYIIMKKVPKNFVFQKPCHNFVAK